MYNKTPNKESGKRRKQIDSISFYAALSRMSGSKNIQHTEGYEMLRQMSYQMQEDAANGNKVDINKIFE